MKIFVTGANGYVGKALVRSGCLPLCSDVTKPTEIDEEIKEKKPDLILHLAAKSDPDFCEKKENISIVNNVNLRGTYNVMYRASIEGIPCVLMSSGQIWKGGFFEREHRENEKKTPPVNTYGISKLAAESIAQMFFGYGGRIVRSSYIFDGKRPNMVSKMSCLKAGEKIYEPTFIRRSFIYLPDFVNLLMEYCVRIRQMPAVLHLAGSETVSWYEFMWEVAYHYGYDTELVKPRRSELKGVAPRPSNAGLNTYLARSLGFRIPSYEDGIKKMKNES